MTEETEQALEELEVITSNQEDIAMEEIAIITVLLETVADDAGQSANVSDQLIFCAHVINIHPNITKKVWPISSTYNFTYTSLIRALLLLNSGAPQLSCQKAISLTFCLHHFNNLIDAAHPKFL